MSQIQHPATLPRRFYTALPASHSTLKRGDDRLIYLVAAASDARTESGKAVCGIGAIDFAHLLERLPDNVLHTAPPTGMDCADCGAVWINDKDRVAIGGADGEAQARDICDHRIIRAIVIEEEAGKSLIPSQCLIHHQDIVAVDLADPDHVRRVKSEGTEKSAPVRVNRRRVVPNAQAKIEGVIRWATHPSLSGTEGMEDGQPFKKREPEVSGLGTLEDLLFTQSHAPPYPMGQNPPQNPLFSSVPNPNAEITLPHLLLSIKPYLSAFVHQRSKWYPESL
jgi:hypothetical protein